MNIFIDYNLVTSLGIVKFSDLNLLEKIEFGVATPCFI